MMDLIAYVIWVAVALIIIGTIMHWAPLMAMGLGIAGIAMLAGTVWIIIIIVGGLGR